MEIQLLQQNLLLNKVNNSKDSKITDSIKLHSQPTKDTVKFTSLIVDETAYKQMVPTGWTRTKWNNHVLKETVKFRQNLINDGCKNIQPLKILFSNAYKILLIIEELKSPFLKGKKLL